MTTYFEDVTVATTRRFGDYEMTREEIREFAAAYDPQWFHTDPERANEDSPYGGLIASGWHTASATMRLLVENVFRDAASVGAKGVDELRWPAPVRPGDRLTVEHEPLDKRPDTPERGVVEARTRTYAGERLVCEMTSRVMYLRRDFE